MLLADYYLALPAVAGAVESVIIKFMSSSFLPGSSETPAMILWISSKIRSKDLYNDAFVHIVGNMSDGSYRARVLRYLESISIDVEMFLNEDIRILSLKFGIERKVAWLSRQQCKASSYTITIMEEAYRKVPNWQGGKHMDPSSKKVFYATFRDSRINSEVSRDVKQLLQDRRRLKLWMGNTECLTCADMGSTYPWEENDDDW